MPIGPRRPDVVLALDNDVLNDWRFRKPATLEAIAEYVRVVKAPPAIPAHTVFEAMHGFEKAAFKSSAVDQRVVQARERVGRLISECTILPFNQDAAEIAAYIFPRLTNSERAKRWMDIFIAATALAHDYGIATRNRVDFERIAENTPPNYPPVRIEVWKSR